MIVEIFLVFVGVAICCIAYGETTKEFSYTIVGCSIFFILFGWVAFGQYTDKDTAGLEFRSGYNITTVGSTSTINYLYTSYNDITTFWIGLFLTIISGLAIILTGIRVNKNRG